MTKTDTLIKNTIIIALGKICTQFLSFFLLPIYTSLLSTSDYGTVDLIQTYIALLAPTITMQQEMAVFRYLIDSRNDKERSKRIISSSLVSVLLIALVSVAIYLVICYFVDFKFKFFAVASAFFTIFSNFFLQIARGLGKNNHFSIASFLAGITTIVSNLVLILVFGFGAESILISAAIANFICTIYLFFALKLNQKISIKAAQRNSAKEMLRYSIPLVPNGVSWWVINVSDRTIISIFINTAANGIYAVSTKFPSIITNIFSFFQMSWTETASLHIDDKNKNSFFSDVLNSTVKIFSCMSVGLIACMPFIFNFFVGDDFVESYKYIPILILGSFFNCIVSFYGAIYIAKKKSKKVMNTSLLSALINLVVNLLLVKFIGIYAAAISTVVAFFTMAVYRHVDVKKYVKLKLYKKTISSTILLFAVGFGVYYLNTSTLNIAFLIFMIIYSIVSNRKLIFKGFKEVGKALKKRK